MKKNFIKSIIILSALFLSVGCKKITDINVSPNNPSLSAATPEVLFPSAVASTAARVGGELNILGGFWSQYYTQSTIANQYRNIDSYNITRYDLNADYNELFSGALEDYQLAITNAKANKQWGFVLMSTVMKAYTYEVLVDLYDQVPYTQAFQGAANIQPVFDKGHDIYVALIKEIDDALAQNYNVPLSSSDASTDLIFGGDMKKWAEFAHTLELKMYLRMVNAYPADAQAGVAKLYANPDFLSVDAGLNIFINTPNKDNPFYEYNIRSLNVTTNIRASYTFVSFLTITQDPRMVSYFGTAKPTSINQGDYLNTNTALGSAASPVQKPTDPVWFISAAESHFLQAEALVRYPSLNGGTTAQAQYMAGVEASFIDNGLAASDADNYITKSTDPRVNWGLSSNKIRTIIYQKWVSFAQGCHTLEGFFDQERTGYPEISPVYSTDNNYVPGQWVYSLNGVTPNKMFPKRVPFPSSEVDRNKNTPTAVPITTPVWWGLTAQ
jgi:hypothetical protein